MPGSPFDTFACSDLIARARWISQAAQASIRRGLAPATSPLMQDFERFDVDVPAARAPVDFAGDPHAVLRRHRPAAEHPGRNFDADATRIVAKREIVLALMLDDVTLTDAPGP